MKKLILLFLLTIQLNQNLHSQFVPVYERLSNDSIAATVANIGLLWHNPKDPANGGYYYPALTQKQPFFSAQLCIGGIDTAGDLRLSCQNLDEYTSDFFPGPLNSDAHTDTPAMGEWSQIWTITSKEVLDFKSATLSGNFDINDPSWRRVKEWPGLGNPFLPDMARYWVDRDPEDFAPFVDVDSNGIYDPESGDYPRMKGDKMCWWIFNDVGDVRTVTYTPAIGVEVGVSAYVYDKHTDRDRLSFYEYRIKNRSGIKMDEFYVNSIIDINLGDPLDDYMSSDSVMNVGFFYNSDAVDGVGYPNEYEYNIPVSGIYFPGVVYAGDTIPIDHITMYENNSTNNGVPSTTLEYYSLMLGFNRLYEPIHINCSPNTNGPVTKFSNEIHHPDSLQCICQSDAMDFGLNMGSEAFTFLPGEDVITFTQVAMLTTQPYDCANASPWSDVIDTINAIGEEPPLALADVGSEITGISLSPNPAKDELHIRSEDYELSSSDIELVNILGQKISTRAEVLSKNEIVIEVCDLSPGIYLIRIRNQGREFIEKFVKE